MLSGVGPKQHLAEYNISAIADLPVGQNLQDHLAILMNSKINSSIGITVNLLESTETKLKYLVFGSGPLTVSGSDGSAFLYLDDASRGKRSPELQIVFYSAYINMNTFGYKKDLADEYLGKDGNVDGFSTDLVNTRPRSWRSEVKEQ